MQVQTLLIEAKHTEGFLASLDRFSVRPGEYVDASRVLEHPHITLYCLDDAARRAVFVETPAEVDLYAAPFFYQAQFEHALRLIAVPYEVLHALAAERGDPPNLILLYSLGRCGSTLLSNAFGELDATLSLSEPDVFTQVTGLREPDGRRDDELVRLLQSCTRLLCKQPAGKQVSTWSLKFRGFCVQIADLMVRAFPKANNLFLYRNAEDWMKSMARLSKMLSNAQSYKGDVFKKLIFNTYPRERFIPLITEFEDDLEAMTQLEHFVLSWLSMMQRYLALVEQGIPFTALRYEDLTRSPDAVLTLLFTRCNLPASGVPAAKRAFARDSQAGTHFSGRANRDEALELREEHLERVRAFIKRHPVIQTSDFTLPHTLLVEG